MAFTGLLFLSVSFSPPVYAQDCTPDEITLSSQAEVDNFQVRHGPCDTVTFKIMCTVLEASSVGCVMVNSMSMTSKLAAIEINNILLNK